MNKQFLRYFKIGTTLYTFPLVSYYATASWLSVKNEFSNNKTNKEISNYDIIKQGICNDNKTRFEKSVLWPVTLIDMIIDHE
jgi:hypothetical protein